MVVDLASRNQEPEQNTMRGIDIWEPDVSARPGRRHPTQSSRARDQAERRAGASRGHAEPTAAGRTERCQAWLCHIERANRAVRLWPAAAG